MTHPLTKILLNSKDSSEALKQIYDVQRVDNPKLTLGYLCKKSGYSSRGALSDIMSGKRRLSPKFKSVFADLLSLSQKQKLYFEILVELSVAKSEADIEDLTQALELAKVTLHTSQDLWSGLDAHDFFAFDIFAVCGLHDDQPVREDFIRFFGKDHAILIDETLGRLVSKGLLGRDGDRYFANKKAIMLSFEALKDRGMYHRFLKKNLNLCVQVWGQRMHDPDFRHSSGMHYIAVKRVEFEQFMKRYHTEIEGHLTAQVADQADTIAHVGYFMYMLEPKMP